MFKKIVTTVISFAIFCTCFSCGSIKYMKKGEVTSLEGKKVVKVQKLDGEVVEFKDEPGRVRGYSVLGSYIKKSEIEINRENVSRIDRIEGGVIEIHTAYGERYTVRNYRETGDKIYIPKGRMMTSITIPLTDIHSIYLKKSNYVIAGLFFGLITGVVAMSAFWSAKKDWAPEGVAGIEYTLCVPAGVLIGGIGGALIKKQNMYVFISDADSTSH